MTPEEIADELAGDFVARHGRRPDGVYAAPGRVNLIGEHVDYNDGRCLPIALRDATYAAVAARDDDVVTVVSRQQDGRFEGRLAELGPGQVTGWAAYVAGVMWAAQADGIRVPGVDVVVHGTVPVAAGLSSSASLSCATGLGVCAAAGLPLDEATRRRLVEICGRAEREVAGAPTGGMDQTASLLAREGYALLLDFRDRSVRHVPWRPEGLGAVLVVVDTRASHELSDGQYGARRDECERAVRELGVASLREIVDDPGELGRLTDPVLHRRTRHVVSEIARVDATVDAIRRGDLTTVGALFDASHASLRDDFEVSCPELDTVCDAARRAGAFGARMTGGGFGGSAIALVPVDAVAAVHASVETAFASQGWRPPRFVDGAAAGGARPIELTAAR